MGHPEMEFTCGTVTISVFKTDGGDYQIFKNFSDKAGNILLGTLLEKHDVVRLFHETCYQLEHFWELGV